MRLPSSVQALLALCLGAVAVSAAPSVSWSEGLLEEINSLRAHGVSEEEIHDRYARVAPPSYNRPVYEASTIAADPSNAPELDNPSFYIEFERPAGLLQALASRISSAFGRTGTHYVQSGHSLIISAPFIGSSSSSRIDQEERRKHHARVRLHEGVGRRGEEMDLKH